MMMVRSTNLGERDSNPSPRRSRSRPPKGNLGGPTTNAAEDTHRGRESAAVSDELHPSLTRSEHRAKTIVSAHSTRHMLAETHFDMNADIACDYDSQFLLISRQGYDRVPHYSPNSPPGQEGHPSPSLPRFSFQGGASKHVNKQGPQTLYHKAAEEPELEVSPVLGSEIHISKASSVVRGRKRKGREGGTPSRGEHLGRRSHPLPGEYMAHLTGFMPPGTPTCNRSVVIAWRLNERLERSRSPSGPSGHAGEGKAPRQL